MALVVRVRGGVVLLVLVIAVLLVVVGAGSWCSEWGARCKRLTLGLRLRRIWRKRLTLGLRLRRF